MRQPVGVDGPVAAADVQVEPRLREVDIPGPLLRTPRVQARVRELLEGGEGAEVLAVIGDGREVERAVDRAQLRAAEPVGQLDRLAARERIGLGRLDAHVVDVGVELVLARAHLALQLVDDVALADDGVRDLDAGDGGEGRGEDLRLILMGRDRLGDDVDLHALEGFGGLNEPLHLLHLVFFGQGRRLELGFDPLLRRGLVGQGGDRTEDQQQDRCRHP